MGKLRFNFIQFDYVYTFRWLRLKKNTQIVNLKHRQVLTYSNHVKLILNSPSCLAMKFSLLNMRLGLVLILIWFDYVKMFWWLRLKNTQIDLSSTSFLRKKFSLLNMRSSLELILYDLIMFTPSNGDDLKKL